MIFPDCGPQSTAACVSAYRQAVGRARCLLSRRFTLSHVLPGGGKALSTAAGLLWRNHSEVIRPKVQISPPGALIAETVVSRGLVF